MQFTAIIVFAACLQVSAVSYAQEVSISGKNLSLKKIFREIGDQTGYDFIYTDEQLRRTSRVTLDVKNEDLRAVLNLCFADQPLAYRIDQNIIVVKPKSTLASPVENTPLELIKITGTVTDSATGDRLQGVTIQMKGGTIGTTTNAQGIFSLSVPDDAVLEVSFLGYRRQAVPVKGRSSFNIALAAATTGLNQLVVVGYGTQRKSDLTGSIVSISGDDIKDMPVSSVAEALQGRAAGVSINKSNGQPGSSSQIIIRGPGSINGLNPLFIIDGVPRGNNSNFDPNDVASIEIIKDASAAAIYGAQAAGGVVLITTKKGSLNQKPEINFSSSVGTRKITKSYRMLQTPDYIKARRGIGENYALWDNPDLPNTNWFDALFQNGTEENYHLSVSGGSPKTSYYISGGYDRENGIEVRNYWERYSLRVNADYHLAKHFTFGHQIYLAKIDGDPTTRDIPWRTLPYMAIYNEDGSFAAVPPEVEFSGTNEVAELHYHHNKTGNVLVDGILYANWQIIDGLNLRVTGSGTFNGSFGDNFDEKDDLARTSTAEEYYKTAGYNESYVVNGVLTYTRRFSQKHDLTAMLGYEARKSFVSSLNAQATDFPVEVAQSFALSSNPDKIASGGLSYDRFLSQFGRINYTFEERYLVSANIRRDGSPKFGIDNRWGIFPSVAVGWKLNEESFFRKLTGGLFSEAKPRLSWGILGNDAAISNFAYEPSYQVIGQHSFDETTIQSGFNSIKVVNKDIKWEQIQTLNAGLDLGLFADKLQLSVDYYSRQTKGMLYNLPIPESSGIAAYYSANSTMPVNIGKISNKGWEFSASYKDRVGDFRYSFSGNLSRNRNKVVDLGLPLAYIYSGSLSFMKGNSPFKTVNGQPVGMIYGLEAEGLISSEKEMEDLNANATKIALEKGSIQPGQVAYYNNVNTGPGDLKYKDLDGDGKITDADRTFLGNPWPKFEYGFTTDLGWKGFDVSATLVGIAGRQVINGSTIFEQSFQQDYQSTYAIFNASYFLGNGLTKQPRLGVADPSNPTSFIKDPSNNYTWYSSYYVENGSYLKVKYLTVGYTVPKEWLSHLGLQNVRVYLTGQNLVTFTKFTGLDPEFSNDVKNYGLYGINTYPQTKLYSAGLDINF